MGISVEASDLDRLQRQALDRLAWEEEQREAAEHQAEEVRKQQVSQEIARQQAAQDESAVSALAGLKPLYMRRKELGEKAAAALAEFVACEEQIKTGLAGIDLAPWPGTPPNHSQDRRQALRARAGLSPWHWRIELRPMQGEANRQALVALGAIARGFLTGDGIRAHTVFQPIDTSDGI